MSEPGITVKTNVVRSHVLYVSSEVMADLRALAMSKSDDPLLSQPDTLGDALLRQALDAIPSIAERSKAIRTFFKQLNREGQPRDSEFARAALSATKWRL